MPRGECAWRPATGTAHFCIFRSLGSVLQEHSDKRRGMQAPLAHEETRLKTLQEAAIGRRQDGALDKWRAHGEASCVSLKQRMQEEREREKRQRGRSLWERATGKSHRAGQRCRESAKERERGCLNGLRGSTTAIQGVLEGKIALARSGRKCAFGCPAWGPSWVCVVVCDGGHVAVARVDAGCRSGARR